MRLLLPTVIISIVLVWVSAARSNAQSLYIPGGVNYVEVGDLDVPGDQITVEAIVTMTGAGVNIVSKHTDQTNVNYLMRPGSVEITTSNGYVNAVSGFTLNMGECYHLAFTYDGTSLDYYINGCLAQSTPHTGTMAQNDFITAIGNRTDCQCESWIGYIDEVRIWNVARTQAEIQANMMDLPNPTTQTGLMAYYKFDGNYTNLQGNPAWDGVPIGAPQLQTNTACSNIDLSFQNVATVTDVSCNGGSDGTVSIASSGGHPNYTYSADGINYYPTNSFSGLPAGSAAVFAQSGANSGCAQTIPITIAEPPAFTTSVTGTDPTNCTTPNGSADLTVGGATPPYTYAWSNGTTVQDPSNLPVGTHTVTITDANQCTTTETITLSAPPPVNVTVTNSTNPLCNGATDGTATISVNGGTAPYSYQWSSGSTQQNATDLPAGNSTVTVTDAGGCTGTANVSLTEPDVIVPNAYASYTSGPGACDGGGFANPSGGTPPYSYSWSNGENTQQAVSMCEGQQTITVTDANGCTGTQNVNVSVPACLTDVDFNTWVLAGHPGNGNWVVENGGARIHQTINGNPTYFVTPEDYINVRMKGKMRTTDGDDDFMGVVFGFQDPMSASDNHEFWLFDWKEKTSGNGTEGFSLCHASGVIPPAQYGTTFWQHNTTPEFTVVATDYGNNGWTRNVEHEVEVVYTTNRAVILVDNDTIFDVYDCFEPGRFGFYNYSQKDVYYSDFTYELFTDFTVETPEICAGDTAQFTFLEMCGNNNNLNQFEELEWDFGDGTTRTLAPPTLTNVNQEHVYATGGNYTVRLIAKDNLGCRDTIFKSITVFQLPTADFAVANQCLTDSTQFSDATVQGSGAVSNWNWNLGDGSTGNTQNPTHQYGAVNTYTVALMVEDDNGCRDTTEQDVEIHVLPQAAFMPIDACWEADYPFQDASTIVSGTVDAWQWDFGDATTASVQNPTHTYASYGQYDVTLVALSDQGCGDTITQQITLHAIPVPGFEVPEICQLSPMQFTDTASVAEGALTNWEYHFGDNASSTQQNATYTYTSHGTMNVQQIVTSNFGCVDSVTVAVVIDPKPVADFATQNECLNDVMSFANQSIVASGSLVTYNWNFGDGNTDVAQNTTNLYANAGNYTVQLIVETDNACTDTTEQQVEVYQLPIADFTFSDVCLNVEAMFTDLSTSNSGVVDSWEWDWGDNTTETGQGPILHSYPSAGDYNVTLRVATDLGCLDTMEQSITIHPMPVALFEADSVCFNQATNFTNLSTVSTGLITNSYWEFGFSATSTAENPTNVFPETGYLPVSLTVTSDFGCKDTVTLPIRVYVLPEPEFVHNDTCFEDLVTFTDQSQISEGFIDAFNWDFGDSQVSDQQNPTHYYTADGRYDATLVTTSNFGCTESVTHQVEIYPLPQIDYVASPAAGCQPLSVSFNNQSQIASGYQIVDYQWDLGQGITSNQTNPQTVYADSGFYDLQIIATSAKGCDDTLQVVNAIDVWPRPVAGFTTEKEAYIMLFPEVDFIDLSTGATEWYYQFDDGFASTDQNPTHEYQQAGTYQVVQTVNNDFGCDAVTSMRVVVEPAITFYIPSAFTPNNDGINDWFYGDGVGIESYNMSIFDRWGELIFFSSDMDYKWDGRYKGSPVPNGTYVYQFTIVDINNHTKQYSGNLQLIR